MRLYPLPTCVRATRPHSASMFPPFFHAYRDAGCTGRPCGQIRQLPNDLRRLSRFQSRTVFGPLTWLFDVHARLARVRSLVCNIFNLSFLLPHFFVLPVTHWVLK
jgi:hypothetical protein